MPQEVKYQGKKIKVVLETTIGRDGQPVQRDLIWHPGAAAILPLTEDGRVCLLRNYRPALGQRLWEIPAGTLEPGESPAAAAARELAEETGYRAGSWQQLAAIYPSPGVLSECIYLFVAQQLIPGPRQPEREEDLEPVLLPWEQVLRWAREGTLQDAKTLLAIFLWEQQRAAAPSPGGAVTPSP
jgi:ADP-ribose pyrophosphatase